MKKKPLFLRFAALSVGLALLLPAGAFARTSFPDVEPGSWYEADVNALAGEGLLLGFPDGTFRPNENITAAQFITIVARCAGLRESSASISHWAAPLLQAALEAGWYDWDELPPTGEGYEKPITRQLAVKVLMRALLPDVRGDYTAESAKISDFSALNGRYYDTTLAAYSAGVAKGDQNGNFRPLSSLTRAEACALIQRARVRMDGQTPVYPYGTPGPGELPSPAPEETPAPVEAIQGGVSDNGALRVVGTQLCNEKGEAVVLRGMSSHGLQWYPQFASSQAMANTAAYGANVFRLAMYTGEGGYLSQPEAMKKAVTEAVEAAVQNDMYVILDWHILSDGNPMDHVEEAIAFFSEMAQQYADTPNVIYEICNEPNGNVSWERDVKPYAEKVVSAHPSAFPRRHPHWKPHLEPGYPLSRCRPRRGGKPDVHPPLLRRHPWRGTADPAGECPGGRTSCLRVRVGRQPGRRQRRGVPRRGKGLDGAPEKAQHQLVRLVPLRQERDLGCPEAGDRSGQSLDG